MAANSAWEEEFNSLKTNHNMLQESLSKYNNEYEVKFNEMQGTNEKINTMVDELEEQLRQLRENNFLGNNEKDQPAKYSNELYEEKTKIGEELYPLVEAITPSKVHYVMSNLVKFDVERLQMLMKSPHAIRAEVDLIVNHRERETLRKRVARFVERAMQQKDGAPSMNSLTVNDNQPLSLYDLSILTEKEQKQIIGERLYPLVEKLNSVECPYIMQTLLTYDNQQLLEMLQSHDKLSAEVEKAVFYVKRKADHERVSRYVRRVLESSRN